MINEKNGGKKTFFACSLSLSSFPFPGRVGGVRRIARGDSARDGDALASPRHDGLWVVRVSVQLNAAPLRGDEAFGVGRDGRTSVGRSFGRLKLGQFPDGFRLAHPFEKDVQAILEVGNFHHNLEAIIFAHRLAKQGAFVVFFRVSEHGVVRLVSFGQDLVEQIRHGLAKKQNGFSQAVVEKFKDVISSFFVEADFDVSVSEEEFHLGQIPRKFRLGGSDGAWVLAENSNLDRFRFPFFVFGEQVLGGLLAVAIPFMAFGGVFSGLFDGSSGGDERDFFSFDGGGGFGGFLGSQKVFGLLLLDGLVASVLVVVGVTDVWRSQGSRKLCLLRHDTLGRSWSTRAEVRC